MSALIASLLLLIGSIFCLVAAVGMLRLPDTLTRMHAATKAGTLALALVLIGAWLLMPIGEWAWRLVLILGFLLATLPVASHLLARAAVVEADLEDTIHNAPLIGDDPA